MNENDARQSRLKQLSAQYEAAERLRVRRERHNKIVELARQIVSSPLGSQMFTSQQCNLQSWARLVYDAADAMVTEEEQRAAAVNKKDGE